MVACALQVQNNHSLQVLNLSNTQIGEISEKQLWSYIATDGSVQTQSQSQLILITVIYNYISHSTLTLVCMFLHVYSEVTVVFSHRFSLC